MGSQEVDNTMQGSDSLVITPEHQVDRDVDNSSVYQPIVGSQGYQTATLQVLGAIQILTGTMTLGLGGVLGSLEYKSPLFRHFFFFTFYTGYPLWGAVFFISSGSLSVAAGRKPTRMSVRAVPLFSVTIQNSFGMNIASATIAFVGFIFLSINIAVNNQSFKSCQHSPSPELCNYMGVLSNGVVSLMLILSLLELCITISVSIKWYPAGSCMPREANPSVTISVEPELTPSGSRSEHDVIQTHISPE